MPFRYQEQLEEQESQFKGQQTKLFQELQRDRENFAKEQAKREAEMQASLQKNHSQYQVEVEPKASNICWFHPFLWIDVKF